MSFLTLRPLFCTAIRTTVHKICDARHGFSPFVLTVFARGGGALLPGGKVLSGRSKAGPGGRRVVVFRVLFVRLPEVGGRIGAGFLSKRRIDRDEDADLAVPWQPVPVRR